MLSGARIGALCLIFAIALAGCAGQPPSGDPEAEAADDPLETTNRRLFALNEQLDTHVFEPVARTWRDVVPQTVRTHLGQALSNAGGPVRLANDMLQGQPRRAGDTLMRFLINTTAGAGGIFDVASDLGYPAHKSEFPVTLAMWGVGSGPYLFIPFAGPADARTLAGYPAGIALSPLTYVGLSPALQAANIARSATAAVDQRADVIDDVDAIRRGALDPYATARSIFRQRTQADLDKIKADRRATVPVWFPQPEAE